MNFLYKVLLVAFLGLIANKSVHVHGCCDPLIPISNFNASRFVGDWNVYAVDRKQDVLNCLVKKFSLFDANNFKYTVSDQFRFSTNNSIGVQSSRIVLGQHNLGFWTNTDGTRIEIIATDYTSFAVCASCTTPFGSNVWVLTRQTYADTLLKYRIATVLNSINFSPNYLIETPFDFYTCGGHQVRSNILVALFFGFVGKIFS